MLFRFLKRLEPLFSGRRFPFFAVGLAVVLTLPDLFHGWYIDDMFHHVAYHTTEQEFEAISGGKPLRGVFNQFRFLDGDPQRIQQAIDIGSAPWWTEPELKLAFFRPLSVLTYMLDYTLWSTNAALMHLHNILWFALFIWVAGMLYRRVVPSPFAAGLAMLLLVLSDAHPFPALFIANRHIFIAGIMGFLSLMAYHRWLQDSNPRRFAGSLALFTVALFCAESGITTLAYLFSYTVFLDRRAFAVRVKSLVPFALVVVCWRVLYNAMDYGAHGSDFYIDPAGEPLTFLYTVLIRLPILLTGLFAYPPADIYAILPKFAVPYYSAAVAVIGAIIVLVFIPLWKNDRVAKFWMLASVLSLIPVCAVLPSNRNLVFAAVAAMGLVGQMIYNGYEACKELRIGVFKKIFIGFCALMIIAKHFLLVPFAYFSQPGSLKQMNTFMTATASFEIPEVDLSGKTVILINPTTHAPFLMARHFLNLPNPQSIMTLAPGVDAVEVERVDGHTLKVRQEGGFLQPPGRLWDENGTFQIRNVVRNVASQFTFLMRKESHRYQLNDTIEMTGRRIIISQLTGDGRPAEITVRFDKPLDDPTHIWLQWNGGGYEGFELPPIGETSRIMAEFQMR